MFHDTSKMKNKVVSFVLMITLLLTNVAPTLIAASEVGESALPAAVTADSDPQGGEMSGTEDPVTLPTEEPIESTQPTPTEEPSESSQPESEEEPTPETAVSSEQPAVGTEQQTQNPPAVETPEEPAANEEAGKDRAPLMLLNGAKTSEFIYELIEDGTAIRVTGWTGTGTAVSIPEQIDGLPVTEITRGNVSSFQARDLTSVVLPKTVKTIGDYAFAGNFLTDLSIPTDSALAEIGAHAFLDSRLTQFNAPASLKKIGARAFMQNRLTDLVLNEGLESIGNQAFALNNLTQVVVPDTITTFGTNVFDANGGRFVQVQTQSPAVPPYENNGPQDFGYVVNPITVTIRYINQKTRAEVMSPVTLGTDMTDPNGVFVKDVEMTYEPPTLSGFYVQPSVTFTPDRDGYILEVEYVPEAPPTLTYPATIGLPEGSTLEEARTRILDAVSAVDYTGKDISDRVEVDLTGLDVGTNGFYNITIRLTDDYGYQISENVQVQVGAYDWLNHEIGGGWVLGDFSFSADGKTLLGLSTLGQTKLRELPAGARNLVLPAHSYNNPDVPITIIGPWAFYNNIYNTPLETVDFSNMKELREIGASAFYSYSRPRNSAISTVVGFNELTKLETIGSQAFYATTAAFNLDGFDRLQSIGTSAFNSYGTSYTGPQITLGSLPSLTRLGSSAFYGATVPVADLRGMPNLTGIESSTFAYAKVQEIYFPEVDHDFYIGSSAFYRNTNQLTYIDLTPIADHLTSIGSYAFSNSYGTSNLATTVVWPAMPKLSSVGSQIFYNRNLNMHIDLSTSPLLTTIGSYAFQRAGLTGVTLPETVERIGSYAFENNSITGIDFGLLTDLKYIDSSAFAYNKIQSVDLSDLPNLETIGSQAFYNNYQIEAVNLDGLPALKTIGTYAFYGNRIADLTLGDLPALGSIQSYAFYNNRLTALSIENLPLLSEIGTYAFGNNQLTELAIRDNPELTSIGNYAFYYNQLGEATLENLPKLTELEAYTFSSNPGHPAYYNNVVVWSLPKENNLIPSKSNYLVNPDPEETLTGDWVAADFTYTVNNGEATITGFSEQGATRFASGVRPVVFPAQDSAGNPVVGIAAYSFANKNIGSIDLTGMTHLKTVGSYAFYNNALTEVNFDGLDQLTEISASAFSNNRLTEVNLGILPKLERIGSSAFYENTITKLNLDGAVSLQTIDSSAFSKNRIAELNFGFLPKLTLIGSSAFYSQSGDPLTVDLSGLPALQTISSSAFSSMNLTSLNFGNLENLRDISSNAFYNHRLTAGELDLSGLTGLTSIGSYAFQPYSSAYGLANVIFPASDSLTSLNNYAFIYNRLAVGSSLYSEAIVHIDDPTGLKNYTSNGWGHLINPKKLIFTYKDRDDNEILPSREEYYKGSKTTETYVAPDMALYLADPSSIEVSFNDTDQVYHVDFVYDELDFSTPTANILIRHTNVDTNRAYVDNTLHTSLSIALSSEAEELNNVQLRIYYNPEYINSSRVTAPLMGSSYTITKPTDGNPYISFNFPRLVGGQSFEIPITWAFKPDYTPQDQVEILYTQLRDENNQLLAASVDGNGNPHNPTLEAYYDPPYIEKGAPGTNEYIGGPRVAGRFTTTEINGQNVSYVDEAADVAYSFRFRQTTNNSNFDRNIETITYIDTLPTYEAVVNGAIVTKTAVINLATSPGWSYYDPVTELPTTEETGYGIITLPNYDKDYAYSTPTLKLQFPGGIEKQTVKNSVDAYLTPANKPDAEPIIKTSDNVSIYLIPWESPPPPKPPAKVEATTFTKQVQPLNVLDYKPVKEAAVFTWPLRFTVGTDDLTAGKFFTNVVFEDFALDDRLVYQKIQLPSSAHTAIVKAFREDGNELTDYGGETVGGVYEFPAYTEGMERIDKITVDLGDREVFTDYSIDVVTTFANPLDGSKPDYAGYNAADHARNYLPNSARVSATYNIGNATGDYVSGISTKSVEILPFELRVIPDKTQTFRSSVEGSDPTVQLPHYPGDEGTYTVGLYRTLNERRFTMTDADLPIENFRMVDLLPLDIVVKYEDIVLDSDFAMQPGAKYEMVADYGSTGRVAIIFTADRVAADVTTVATIQAKLDLAMDAGYHKNDLYLSFDTGGTNYWGYGQSVTTDDLGDNPANQYMKDYVSLFMAKAQAMNAMKHVRNAELDAVTGKLVGTGTWTEGVYTEDSGYLQYRLFVKNDTIHDRNYNSIYDVFPYYMDEVTQCNAAGQRANRGSAFSNIILAARLYGTTANEFKIEFTTGDVKIPENEEAGAYLSNLYWAEAGTDGAAPAQATGMRIIPKDGYTGLIKEDDTLIVIVDAQAPPHSPDTAGKRGYNSFVRKDDALPIYIEVPSVWNEVPTPKGTLQIEKYSRTFDPTRPGVIAYNEPVAGAVFTLYTTGGIQVAQAVSNAAGLVEFKNVAVGDYIMSETSIPPNHHVPAEMTQIRIKRSDWEKKPELLYHLGRVYNDPIVKGTVELEKYNGVGSPMPGIAFALTDKATGVKYLATTDHNGKASFADIPYGAYTLTETNAPKLLMPIAPKEIKIDTPGKVVRFIGANALRNDKAELALFKLGIRGALSAEKDLSKYTKSDGTIVAETWNYEIRNLTDPTEPVKKVTFTAGHIRNGVPVSDLKVGDLYEIKEVSGPSQTQTLYNHNTGTYQFKINAAGELLDAADEKFKAQSIYFPNERKRVDGAVIITKKDDAENALPGATFSLAKLNKATSVFEVIETQDSDPDGKVHWTELAPGSYEIREVAAPTGYIKTNVPYRFIVEDFATTGMLTNSDYEHRAGGLTHHFAFTALNQTINLSLIKRHLVAANVPEQEKDTLLAENPSYQAFAKPVGYDVYEPLSGAEFTLYKAVTVNDVPTREVVAEGLISGTGGLIPVNEIPGFSWDETATYYLEETKTKDETWLLPENPLIIDLPAVIRNHPTGTATVFMENQPKQGQILISKYDRYTGFRMEGVEFTLYKGTKDTYSPESPYRVGTTDAAGYRRFNNLPLGDYVFKETATLDGYVLDETIHEVSVTASDRYFYYHIYNLQKGELVDIPVRKEWLGTEPEYAPGDGLVVDLFESTRTSPIETVTLTRLDSWAYVFKDLLKRDNQGRAYTYVIRERGLPAGYEFAIKEGQVQPAQLPADQTVAEEIILKNHALANLSVSKTWQDRYPDLRPEAVTLTLMRAEYDADTNSYGDYVAQGAAVQISETTAWSHTWRDLKTHDVNGKPYRYKVTEAETNGYQLVAHEPAFVQLTGGVEAKLTLTNRQYLNQAARKDWSDNAPTVKPTVVFQLVRKTAGMADYEAVADAPLKTLSDGSARAEWTLLPATDGLGNLYTYSVFEGCLDEGGNFVRRVPENYRSATTVEPVYNAVGLETGTEVVITNTWQETDFTATKTWSDNAPAVKPDVELVLRQNGELYNGTGVPQVLQNDESQVIWEHLPVYYYSDKDLDGVVEEYKYEYSVDELNVPESYEKQLIGKTQVRNIYHSVALEAKKSFDLSLVMPDFKGTNVLPESVRFSLYKTSYDAATGTASMKKFDEAVLDGRIDADTTDAGETAEWLYTWKKLPKYYEVKDEGGQISRFENKYEIVEEVIPKYYELMSVKDVSETGMLRWEVNNRYRNGFTACKTWDIGAKTAADLGGLPPIELQLYRGIVAPNGEQIDQALWSESVGQPVTLDGCADDAPLGTSRETTEADSLTWTYSWFEQPIYGEFDGSADLSAYGISAGDRVLYFYYAEEVINESLSEKYSVDAVSSASTLVVNRLDKTDFTAYKEWVNGPVNNRPQVEFVLYVDYLDPATGEMTAAEEIQRATLDGIADEEGEIAPWVYSFRDLPHYVKNEDGSYLKDADDRPVLYHYFVEEETVPEHYELTAQTDSRITNSYVIPPLNVEITKTWSGGNPEDYDKIKLQLYRTSEIMTEPEPVSSDYERIVKSETEFVYVFNDLDATDIDGHAYTYFAKEAGAVDDIVTVGQNRYQSAVSGTEISNTYILKRTDVEAKKIWVGGSDARRPEIYFKLYRATEGADTEVVPGTEIKVLKPGTTQVIWEGVEAEAAFNQPYTFSVKEGALDPVTGLFIETAPVDYTAAYDGLVVTNTYIPPKAYPPHLTKTGSKNKPPFLARTGEYSGSAPPAALALLSAAILILIRRRRRSKE